MQNVHYDNYNVYIKAISYVALAYLHRGISAFILDCNLRKQVLLSYGELWLILPYTLKAVGDYLV